ncbi:hypothetical protein [Candidatus Methylocalor cossyra]|uniref:Bestrophin, RFP-TM, chloride channel n=1 Tax=Candidatus Methylocalor cossyra TaxID=3108543 RepID=A0ABM9NIT5_9GAMM
MPGFHLLAATRTLEKTMPFVLYRLLLCLAVTLGYVLATLLGAGFAIALASLSRNPTVLAPLGAVLGFGGFGFLMYRLRPLWLHGVEARHLALLAAQAGGRPIPDGKAQLDHGGQRVAQSFPSPASLCHFDRLLRQALAEVPAPPAAGALGTLQGWLTRRLSSLNHRTVLARHLGSEAGNPWRDAVQGVLAQARHGPYLVRYRLYGILFEGVGIAAVFPLMLAAVRMLTTPLPIQLGLWAYLFATLLTWVFKAAFLEPIAEAALLASFLPLAAEPGDATARAELERRSSAFGKLLENAG